MTCMVQAACVARRKYFRAAVSSLVTSGDHAKRDSCGYEGDCSRRPAPALVFSQARSGAAGRDRSPPRAATHALASHCITHIQKSAAGMRTSGLIARVVSLRAHYGPAFRNPS